MTVIQVHIENLQAIHSALDDALGDTDASWIENDEQLRLEEPVEWAAQRIAELINAHVDQRKLGELDRP